MIRIVLYLVVSAQLFGCSAQDMRPFPRIPAALSTSESLWQVRIEHWRKERFSGLLALRKAGEDIGVVLLDSTGIKLMEAVVSRDRAPRIIYAMHAIREHNLPDYLCRSLQRIFHVEPDGQPCSRAWLYSLCRYALTSEHGIKRAGYGPVVLWKVDFFTDSSNADPMVRSIRYSSWPGPKLKLELL